MLRRKPSVWSYCICREEVLGLDTRQVVGDPRTSILEGLCCEGDRLPPARPAEAWLRAEQRGPHSRWHSHLHAVVESKPDFSRLRLQPEIGVVLQKM